MADALRATIRQNIDKYGQKSSPFQTVRIVVFIDIEAFRLGYEPRVPAKVHGEIGLSAQAILQLDVQLLPWRKLEHFVDFQCESLWSDDCLPFGRKSIVTM